MPRSQDVPTSNTCCRTSPKTANNMAVGLVDSVYDFNLFLSGIGLLTSIPRPKTWVVERTSYDWKLQFCWLPHLKSTNLIDFKTEVLHVLTLDSKLCWITQIISCKSWIYKSSIRHNLWTTHVAAPLVYNLSILVVNHHVFSPLHVEVTLHELPALGSVI